MHNSYMQSDSLPPLRLIRPKPIENLSRPSWLAFRLSKKVLLFVVVVVLMILFTITGISHQQLGRVTDPKDIKQSAQGEPSKYFDCAACDRDEISELSEIKTSVLSEMTELEKRYHGIKQEISAKMAKITALDDLITGRQKEIERLNMAMEQMKLLVKEVKADKDLQVWAPLKLSHESKPFDALQPDRVGNESCSIDSCIDFSRCSVISPLSMYVYDLKSGKEFDRWKEFASDSLSRDPENVCVFLAFLNCENLSKIKSKSELEIFLRQNLPYFGKHGRNNVIVIDSNHDDWQPDCINAELIPTQLECVFVTSLRHHSQRQNFDILTFPFRRKQLNLLDDLAPILPAKRDTLVLFTNAENSALSSIVAALLKNIKQSETPNAAFVLQLSPQESLSPSTFQAVCLKSTFVVFLSPDASISPGEKFRNFYRQLNVALSSGAIPVLLGYDSDLLLPLDSVIDWNRILIRLPTARLPELYFLLSTLDDNEIVEMRRQGRLVIQHYFADLPTSLNSVLALLGHRLKLPLRPHQDKSGTLTPITATILHTFDAPALSETDEYLGPVEKPESSLSFMTNFSSLFGSSYYLWNDFKASPMHVYPSTPFRSVLPSDAKFRGSSSGFRPIDGGRGGSGKEFSFSLGGNHPKEQFTVVLLTFERESVLMQSLRRFSGLPYLNKVVVVWNSLTPPAHNLVWPKLSVPLVVLFPGKNSLNNRFLPYDVIETDAVLSIDDDAHLRHDEIIFGFRVWRESRERIVGFPGRFHAYDPLHSSWLYNSNHSCELSMVLTGAAFIHRFYFYVYTFEMPGLIRDKVDEYMNCEDIAINFLVSHVTRQPPVKVTSRWTFRCPGCTETLSLDESHFQERHKCINFFTKVYGYNPLLYTQHRADSVLFKTRIPHTAQKCFKFV